jgi:hypothetical protein
MDLCTADLPRYFAPDPNSTLWSTEQDAEKPSRSRLVGCKRSQFTILSMTSIEERRPSCTRTTLLIVDAQVGLVELMPAEVQRSVLPRIRTLIAKARASAIPVIYIQHDGAKGHPLETQAKGWEIYPLLKPADGEPLSGSENRTHSSERRFNVNLRKEGLPTSSLREA